MRNGFLPRHSLTCKLLAVFLFFVCFRCLLIGDFEYGQVRRGLKDRLDRLPFPFSTVAEFEASTSTFYGRLKKNGTDFFLSIDALTGKAKLLGKIPPIDGWIQGASALDSEKYRFFLAATQNKQDSIIVVKIETGDIIRISRLSHPIKSFEYDASTEKLLGLARIDGVERFVSIDPSTGEVAIRGDLNSVSQTYSGVSLDSHQNKMYFVGIREGRDAAWEVDTGTGSIRELSSRSIRVNDHLIHSFKESGAAEAVFTAGAQSCTGIAGYDARTQIGFIAHFAANFPETELSLLRIDRELQEKYSLQGLIDLRFWVVGGVRDMPASIQTLHTAYRVLVERFGVEFDEITKFNTGVSYNILIHKGEVRVF
jgi:hypothetical protein